MLIVSSQGPEMNSSTLSHLARERCSLPLVYLLGTYGEVAALQIYHQDDETVRKATQIVNVGTILVVKEPYFKITTYGDHDIWRIWTASAPSVSITGRPRESGTGISADSLKLEGNAAIGQGLIYVYPCDRYTNALKQQPTQQETEIIKRNRSLALLRTGQYDAALSDKKSLFHASEALYHFGRFAEFGSLLEQLRVKYPSNSEAVSSLIRAKRRLQKHSNGNINIASLQARATSLYPPLIDRATYLGPVEIRDTDDCGSGLFVTRAIEAGELLLCGKAFSYAYVPDQHRRGNADTKFLMNPETGRGFIGAQADLLQMIVQRLFKCPSIAPSFTNLYHGSYVSINAHEVDGKPVFLSERIMASNVFGCPHSSLQMHRDIMANKDYLKNCHRAFIGDIMIVRAAKDLDANTELRFCYHHPTSKKDIQEHQKILRRGWGLGETPASTFATRCRLLGQLSQICAAPMNRTSIRRVQRMLKSLNDTYNRPAKEAPRLALSKNERVKALEALGKSLEAFGFVFVVVEWGSLVDHVVEMFRIVHDAFKALGLIEDSTMADGYARTAYRALVGEDGSYEATAAGYPVMGLTPGVLVGFICDSKQDVSKMSP
ncbi:hypothetical protein EJ04DRAFT_539117 [Polyplosphaeria fusca]|uniref:SET domain-containing protein n=1 Tax=Polyplosphaeria fusca TaxID=682080 RepID=A0A9P4UVQ9_9PLEO|nr:hypothetical protein EJ04DRAFT_539117 [Polyplosphaeria fusca]